MENHLIQLILNQRYSHRQNQTVRINRVMQRLTGTKMDADTRCNSGVGVAEATWVSASNKIMGALAEVPSAAGITQPYLVFALS